MSNMATKSDLLGYKNIINNRNRTEYQVEMAEKQLKELLAVDCYDYKIHVLLGKLYLIKNDILEAKKHFLKAIHLNKQAVSTHYGLFKVNIMEGYYSSAKNNLEKMISLYKNHPNLELYRLLLDKILGEETEYTIDDTFFYDKLNGYNLILYLNAIKAILDEQYKEAITLLENLNESVIEDQIYINFDYIILLVKELDKRNILAEKQKEKETKTISSEEKIEFEQKILLLKNAIWNNEHTTMNEIVSVLVASAVTDEQIKILLHQIPKLLNVDAYDIATYLNTEIKKKDKDYHYTRMTAFYERFIKELKTIYDLEGYEKEQFQYFLRKGLDALHEGNGYKALRYFSGGATYTNIPLFYYYMGKTYYLLENYTQARKVLNIYNECGAYKINLCKCYLSIINWRFGKKGKAIQQDKEASYFADLLNKPFMSTKEFLNNDDDKLDKLFEVIDMTEEDFTGPNYELKING